MPSFSRRLDLLVASNQTHLLRGGLKGLEKESLRLDMQGRLSTKPHPIGLGSALTHDAITTDYSEALIELITPAFSEVSETLRALANLHRFVLSKLEDEVLLATSMPIGIEGDESIPIADYGRSNIGRMKRIYREGLGHRYGRTMQAIAGLHYNYSFQPALFEALHRLESSTQTARDHVDACYFGVVRNVHRYAWILIYLFGHSPAMTRAFLKGRESLMPRFTAIDKETLALMEATSLRMSDIGYRNDNQNSLEVNFDTLEGYVASLGRAIQQPYPPYEAIGVKVDGVYRQLSDSILQIENEYYSPVRPKQVALSGEMPTLALKKRGVRYLELRVMDLQCFEPAGINEEALRFLEVFVIWCALRPSPPLSPAELSACGTNNLKVACCGRSPTRQVLVDGRAVPLIDEARRLLDELGEVATWLDQGGPSLFQSAIKAHASRLRTPDDTPSARVLEHLLSRKVSFADFALTLSRQHARHWQEDPLSASMQATFEEEAAQSLSQQSLLESTDQMDFDAFLKAYRSQS